MSKTKSDSLLVVAWGHYLHPSGWHIVRTEFTGPRGGRRRVWELAYEDSSGVTVEDSTHDRTVKAAWARLEHELANETRKVLT